MWKTKLCLDINDHAIALRRMEEWKKIGFEGFFVGWERGTDLMPLREKADELGLDFQSIHAPFGKADRLWKSGEQKNRKDSLRRRYFILWLSFREQRKRRKASRKNGEAQRKTT